MPKYRRAEYRAIAAVLNALSAEFLTAAKCYFGGGTYLAMTLGEYRVSRDIDFLCSDRAGFRQLREEISDTSLGGILRLPLELVRDVRVDRDGIRTFVMSGDARIKLEILFESRIDLAGPIDRGLSLPVLSPEHCVAEKLLANADRGLDDSTLSRDLIDLAFAIVHFGKPKAALGVGLAESAYGTAVRRYLAEALDRFQRDRARAAACIKSLTITDTATLRKGLRALRTLL